MTTTAPSIDLIWQPGVPKEYVNAAENALRRATVALGVSDQLPVAVIGVHADVLDILVAARTAAACTGKKGQAHADVLATWLRARRWRPKGYKSLVMLIVNDDIAAPEDEFIFGFADDGIGGAVSTYRYARDCRITDRIGLFEKTVMHELGHAVGAADPDRGTAVEMWFGPHCMNDCVMRQCDDLPQFETEVLPVSKTATPFCTQCVKDVRRYMGGWLAE